jgi:hypothetical protein
MGKALRYRLFGMGKMPAALKEAAAVPGVLLAEEGVSVTQSVHTLRMPRASVSTGTKLLIGSIVLHPGRALAALGSYPILDSDLRPAATPNATLAIAADGVRISLDVGYTVPDASGTVTVHYKLELAQVILNQLSATGCPVVLTNVMPALLKGWKGTWAA